MLSDDQPLTPVLSGQVLEAVRAYMHRREFTNARVARALGISEGTLSGVLSGGYAAYTRQFAEPTLLRVLQA